MCLVASKVKERWNVKKCENGWDKYENKILKNRWHARNIVLLLIFFTDFFKFWKIWGLFFLKMNECRDHFQSVKYVSG